MADYNIFVYIFHSNKKRREKCGTFFLILFLSKNEPWNQRFTAETVSKVSKGGLKSDLHLIVHPKWTGNLLLCEWDITILEIASNRFYSPGSRRSCSTLTWYLYPTFLGWHVCALKTNRKGGSDRVSKQIPTWPDHEVAALYLRTSAYAKMIMGNPIRSSFSVGLQSSVKSGFEEYHVILLSKE